MKAYLGRAEDAGIAALSQAITDAKSHPLDPVTVIVPSNYVGLHVRRRLVQRHSDCLINVRFMILARLAELLGAPNLSQDRRPLSGLARSQAVRLALRRSTVWGHVAGHAGTVQSAAQTLLRLSRASSNDREACLSRREDLEELWRAFVEVGARHYRDDEVLDCAAVLGPASSAALTDLGHIVFHLPRTWSHAEAILAQSLASRDLASRVDVDLATSARSVRPQCVLLADAEQEARWCASKIAALARGSVPLYRIGVLYQKAEPYGPLVQQILAAAGVPCNGRSNRRLSQTAAGRALTGFYRFARGGCRRDDLVAWLGSAPLVHEGRVVPTDRWTRLTRDLDVHKGEARFKAAADRLAAELAAQEREEGSWQEEKALQRTDDVRSMLAFVQAATNRYRETPLEASWTDYRDAALDALEAFLGKRQGSEDQDDLDAVRDAVQGLGTLEAMEERATRDEFLAMLDEALSASAPGHVPYGHGAFVGSLLDAYGLEFDASFILGMVEGSYPPIPSDDPLLPLDEPGIPPLRPLGQAETDYRHAVAAASKVWLLSPRSDTRAKRANLPSRWFLSEVAQACGLDRVYADDLESSPAIEHVERVESFQQLVVEGQPGCLQEFSLKAVNQGALDGAFPKALRPKALRSRQAAKARAASELTAWDGLVQPKALPRLSASRLETYGTCPQRFFLKYVLGVLATQEPDADRSPESLTRGLRLHEILRDFFANAPAIAPDETWSDDQRNRMRILAHDGLSLLEEEGLVEPSPLWEFEKANMVAALVGLLDRDDQHRRKNQCRPWRFEEPFENLKIGDLEFSGQIDRIDRSDDGGLIVIDYKSGKSGRYSGMDRKPLLNGRALQLPIYGMAALSRGEDGTNPSGVTAAYWFLMDTPAERKLKLSQVRDEFLEVIEAFSDSIKRGLFPMMPGKDDQDRCKFCDFNRVCPLRRREAWDRVRTDPALVALTPIIDAQGIDSSGSEETDGD